MTDSGKIYLSSLNAKQLEIAQMVNKDNNDHLSDNEISVFLAECELNGIDYKPSFASKIYNKICALFDSGIKKAEALLGKKPQQIEISKTSEPLGPPESKEMRITQKAYDNWSKVFKDSPLDKAFYEKLYSVMKRLNVELENKDEPISEEVKQETFDNIYKELGFEVKDKKNEERISTDEQAFNEFIAILAGESQLKPDAKNGPYRGLFQLSAGGLKEIKTWARTNEAGSADLNIDQNITIDRFAKLSGEEQLDYLVAYIEKMKEYSKISPDEKITPAQVWTMIKQPFQGKNEKLIKQTSNKISKIITQNNVEISPENGRDNLA